VVFFKTVLPDGTYRAAVCFQKFTAVADHLIGFALVRNA
jgi:hypothetical protein